MSVQFIQAKRTTLNVGISAAETTEIVLKKLVDIYDNDVEFASFGTIAYFTIEPGSDNEEIISITGFTRNADDTVSLNAGITRGLAAVSPYASGGTARAHAAGVPVVVSNNPQIYASLVSLTGAQTVAGVKTFSSLPATTAGNPVADNDLARKAYVDSVVAGTFPANRVVVAGNAGETVATGNLVYFDDTDNEWKKCDADTAGSVDNVLLGIAQGAGVDGGAISSGVLLFGLDLNQSGLTDGDILYASNTAGGISASAGTTEVSLGIAKGTTGIYFAPRYNQQITENQQDALAGTSGTPSTSNKYVTDADTSATSSASKVIRANGSGKLDTGFLNLKNGGTGADGALTITSGTTTIDLGSASVVIKNYTSISITGTGSLAFTNPAAGGTLVVLKTQAGPTLTSSATPMIDCSGLGAAGGVSVTNGGAVDGNNGTAGNILGFLNTNPGTKGVAAGPTAGSGGAAITNLTYSSFWAQTDNTILKYLAYMFAGAGGASGSVNNGTSSAGGRGGGALVIESGGALNFTTASGISVAGKAPTGSPAGTRGGSGAGAGGSCLIVVESITANTGTITVSGGTGETGSGTPTAGGGGGGSDTAGSDGNTANPAVGGNGANGRSAVMLNTEFF